MISIRSFENTVPNLPTGDGVSAASLSSVGDGALPAIHKVVFQIRLFNLTIAETRNITIRIASAENVYVDCVTPVESGDYAFNMTFGPYAIDNDDGYSVTVTSDNPNDTGASLGVDIYSDDIEFYLAYRAAEASPTADSIIERVKTVDDSVSDLHANQSDWTTATGFSTHAPSDIWAVTERIITADTNINYPSSDAIADAVLTTDVSDVQDTAGEHSLTTIVLATTESAVAGSAWTIKKTDGTTFVVKTITSDADAVPITAVD